MNLEDFDLTYDLDPFTNLQEADFSCDLDAHVAPTFHGTYDVNNYGMPVNTHSATDQVESAIHFVAAESQ